MITERTACGRDPTVPGPTRKADEKPARGLVQMTGPDTPGKEVTQKIKVWLPSPTCTAWLTSGQGRSPSGQAVPSASGPSRQLLDKFGEILTLQPEPPGANRDKDTVPEKDSHIPGGKSLMGQKPAGRHPAGHTCALKAAAPSCCLALLPTRAAGPTQVHQADSGRIWLQTSPLSEPR